MSKHCGRDYLLAIITFGGKLYALVMLLGAAVSGVLVTFGIPLNDTFRAMLALVSVPAMIWLGYQMGTRKGFRPMAVMPVGVISASLLVATTWTVDWAGQRGVVGGFDVAWNSQEYLLHLLLGSLFQGLICAAGAWWASLRGTDNGDGDQETTCGV